MEKTEKLIPRRKSEDVVKDNDDASTFESCTLNKGDSLVVVDEQSPNPTVGEVNEPFRRDSSPSVYGTTATVPAIVLDSVDGDLHEGSISSERRLIGNYFEVISQDSGKFVFGVEDTLKALEMGAVETLIVWENLDISRYILKNSVTGETSIQHFNKEEEDDQSNFRDLVNNAELEVQEKLPLPEWFANEYQQFGCALEFVTDKSEEGSQFCRGFGGIGGILRYRLDDGSGQVNTTEGDLQDTTTKDTTEDQPQPSKPEPPKFFSNCYLQFCPDDRKLIKA
ncbi:hypothetical protein MKW98_017052 [Papaver atlanticum]|uniref:eRF1 domain-containing protein n=1 Tax=Papaver atlanticum TaxID=357466 RepID=A0AAD4TH90_9MAGN|nr:hypothetical protein MKW98_017052 [Papaver atlanticum]